MVLDADHGVVEAVGPRVRLRYALRLVDVIGSDDLYPVAVRVEREGDVPHAAVLEPLLEAVAGVSDALAGGLDVVDGDADVAEAAAGVAVAVGDGVGRVGLGAVVVGEFKDALAVGPVGAGGGGAGGVVGEEVEVEFGGRLGDVVDLGHAEVLVEFDWEKAGWIRRGEALGKGEW